MVVIFMRRNEELVELLHERIDNMAITEGISLKKGAFTRKRKLGIAGIIHILLRGVMSSLQLTLDR